MMKIMVIMIVKVNVFFIQIKQGGHKPGKPGILGDFSEHGKLREFKYLCKTAVDWVNRIIRISGSSEPAQ